MAMASNILEKSNSRKCACRRGVLIILTLFVITIVIAINILLSLL